MKNRCQIIFLLLPIFYAVSMAQITQTITLSPTAYKVVCVFTGGTSFGFNQAENYSIGHQNISSPYEDDIWHSMYQFDLSSIPANAVIASATLQSYVTGYISIDDGQYYYNQIVKLLSPTVNPATLTRKQIFDGAVNGIQKASHHYNDTAYTNVASDIIAGLTYGKVVYGGSCSQEQYTTSKALLNLKLTIKYYLPFNVTAQNERWRCIYTDSNSTNGQY
jgi:hypothetical protein